MEYLNIPEDQETEEDSKWLLYPGFVEGSLGQKVPFQCSGVIESLPIFIEDAVRAEAGQMPLLLADPTNLHPFALNGKKQSYDVRQYGCMPCGLTWVILGPIWMLQDEYGFLECSFCGLEEMIPISYFFIEPVL